MKTVYSNSEIAHIWVNNGQIEARNGNNSMSFHSDKFYSYRTVIARRVNGTIVLSSRTYSNTTNKHQSAIKSACDYKHVQCYDVNDTPAENFDHVKKVISSYIEKQKRARKTDYLGMARTCNGCINRRRV